MTNRFTESAQNALNSALEAAREFGHSYIGSEHLLIGLLREEDSIAAKVLGERSVTERKVSEIVESISGKGGQSNVGAQDMTPRTKRIIETSSYMALRSGQNYIGTEHILLALLSESDCVAVRILSSLGCNIREIYEELTGFVSGEAEDGR